MAKSGQPVPRLVWFYFDGADVTVYSMPNAAKVRHVRGSSARSTRSMSKGADGPFWDKYKAEAEQFGITDAFAAYSTRLKIAIDKVWTTPEAPED